MSTSGGPGRGAVFASIALHVVVAAGLVASAQARPASPPMRVYRVSIYSPPPRQRGPTAPAAAAPEAKPEKPEPEPEKPKPEPEKKATKAVPAPPKPKPQPEKKAAAPKASAKDEKPHETTGPRPDAHSAGGEDLNVKLEGEEFAYPGYLENIIVQVRRYFRWEGAAGLRTEVYFVIHRDGSVSDIRIGTSSGNREYDYQALGAVEVAGKRGAFGPLPKGFQGDRLPVSFYIDTPR